MSYAIKWYVDKQVIYIKLSGVVTTQEVTLLNRQTVEHVQQGIQPVHVIIDTLEVEAYPENLRWVMELMRNNRFSPTGWNVIVQKHKAIRLLGSTILSILGVPYHTCATLDEARAFFADLHIAPTAQVG